MVTKRKRAWVSVIAVPLLGMLLSALFWPEFWQGAGLIGGDATGYFLPQKTFLADHLARGDLPLWNNLVGHGYSFVGDSQIALWYPTTVLLYGLLSVNAAINATFLGHYVLAFALAWLFARQCGLGAAGSCLTALVFTYGYFPCRVSFEWVITTGAWLPLGWACLEGYLRTSRRRWLFVLTIGLTIQLLAGHFHNAFITHVWLTSAAVLRVSVARRKSDQSGSAKRTLCLIVACQAASFPLAAAQLLPTWEMRSFSERQDLPIRDIEYGRIPPRYLKQLISPWSAYRESREVGMGERTNRVAAQLYLGIASLVLAALGVWQAIRQRDRILLTYGLLAAFALCFAVGRVWPLYQYLPGFGWFTGVGRYAIVFALGTGLLAGAGLDVIGGWCGGRRIPFGILAGAVLVWTFVDLRAVGRGSWPCPDPGLCVRFAAPMGSTSDESRPPPVMLRENSPLRELLKREPGPVRLLAPLHNSISTLGIAVLPGYLGLKPQPYVDEQTRIPDSWPHDSPPGPGQLQWLQRAGVTHLLFLNRSALEQWQNVCEPKPEIGVVYDRFLAAMFARVEPFYLMPIPGTRGRIAWTEPNDGSVSLTHYRPDHVEAKVSSQHGGTVVLTDFDYPGWGVSVDGLPAEGVVVDGAYRGVRVPAGDHVVRWSYRPWSVYGGIALSTVSLVVLILVFVFTRTRNSSAAADAPVR